ncbi:copper resistance CopC family protein [Phytoactinopolyspora halotolerans]|uniref:Copper resistance protein CopC n=1 Tax=Phytoactinopolyspora halotolerans TaxID=1981512 RepID=A0A6L9SFA1_9ACTN|nr:copper resistance CopC family protein [Phytoactinopolyspora halotolerans]NEE03799.1 copper resistance protein CopC [Phytoactinopolyspora halotolerans]
MLTYPPTTMHFRTGDSPPTGRVRGSTARAARTAVTVALTAVLAFALGTPTASAHSSLVSSSPEDGATVEEQPGTVELVFNENVQDQPDFTQMAVLDADENEFHTADPVVDGNRVRQDVSELPDGDYTISYRIVSADGHPVSGTIEFTMATGMSGDVANGDEAETASEQASGDGDDSAAAIWSGIVIAVLAGLALIVGRSRRRLRESSEDGPTSDDERDR